MKKMLLIVNPHAGVGAVAQHLLGIVDCFNKHHCSVTVYITQEMADATKQIAENDLSPYDCIVCSGGDGTLNETISGMMAYSKEKRLPMGYIPAGTTNDFANSLKLSKDMVQAAKDIMLGKEDVLILGGSMKKNFIYVAAFGLFTEVSYSTSQEVKNNMGRIAYLLAGIKSLVNIKSYQLHIEAENEVIEDDFIYGQISNSASIGGFQVFASENIQLDDGLFEMMFIRMPNNLLDLQNVITALLTQDIHSGWIIYRKVSKVHIQSAESVNWTLDGEFGGSEAEVQIFNQPQAITLFVPE